MCADYGQELKLLWKGRRPPSANNQVIDSPLNRSAGKAEAFLNLPLEPLANQSSPSSFGVGLQNVKGTTAIAGLLMR
jgi:hypothetical protein